MLLSVWFVYFSTTNLKFSSLLMSQIFLVKKIVRILRLVQFVCSFTGHDRHPKFKSQWAAISKSGYETSIFHKEYPSPLKITKSEV